MLLCAIVFLLDDQLAFGFAIALNLALKLVEAVNDLRLDSAQVFLQILHQ